MSKSKEAKFNKEVDYKEVVKYLKTKGFYVIDKQEGSASGSITKKFSHIQFGHKKLDGLGLTKLYTPNLIFYYDPSNKGGFFFHLAISIARNDKTCFIPFYGQFHTIVRRNKTLSRVSEHLKELFDNYTDFVDFLQDLRKTVPSKRQRSKFLTQLIEQRFHPYFIAHDKKIIFEKIDHEQFLPQIPGLKDSESLFGLYVRFVFSNLNKTYYMPQTFFYEEPKSNRARVSTSRKPIENRYRIRQFFDLCSNVLFETYNRSGEFEDEETDPDVFVM